VKIACLARTRTYEKEYAGLTPGGAPSQLASQVSGTTGYEEMQTKADDSRKEVLANWSILPPSIRQAIVAIIRCIILKHGRGIGRPQSGAQDYSHS
jgi:hypothetical protein